MKTRADFTLTTAMDPVEHHWPFHWVEGDLGLGWLHDPRTISKYSDILYRAVTNQNVP